MWIIPNLEELAFTYLWVILSSGLFRTNYSSLIRYVYFDVLDAAYTYVGAESYSFALD